MQLPTRILPTWNLALVAAVSTFGLLSEARADWALAGAQYRCDRKAGVFELLPYNRSSSGDDVIRPGYHVIAEDAPTFTCRMGDVSLRVKIEVFPPAAHGTSKGGGFVRAQSISASNIELLPDSPAFDWSISPSEPALTRIRVTANGSGQVTVERCSLEAGRGQYDGAYQAY
jgi:hypothetical protein